ncbi:para-nitrobenzyl esterase [Lactobacillus colini]|uniref:Carboxylic ester hydrolase n=1 Tax=Lactobacillus colini TaxID=1819254 RepID=A0ABS4MEX2_9LACO|nr:carboxylesterase family protein [Lactobacillus colini]MBP2058236.1 para-nitrobenzyl esterase [Lactobacillus colini]
MKLKLIGSSFVIATLVGIGLGTMNQAKAATTIRQTQFGKVKGQKDGGVLQWKGIPYGGSVSGKNRWQAPNNPKKWKGVKNTTKSISAIQYNSGTVSGSEKNALTLDIYRPNTNKKNLPVIVYIHGGNNQTGSSTEIPGTSFIKKHDAIYIAINYRLGVLGFNPLSALKNGSKQKNSGNYALLDMAKALTWVQKNAKYFGGNKNNVTVAGFSAGGRDVMAMLISPIFKGKFNKAIAFSGGMTTSDTVKSQQVFAKAIAPLAVKSGKAKTEAEAVRWLTSTNKSDQKAVRKFLYNIKASDLAKLMGNASIRMSVFPHLYKDGVVIPKNGFDTKKYNQVPVVMTSGSREFSLFEAYDPYFAKTLADGKLLTDPQYQFGFKYGGELYGRFNVENSANKMLKQGYKANIYGMNIDFGNDIKVVGPTMATYGAYHGVFVPMLDTNNTSYKLVVGDAYKSDGARAMLAAFQNYIYNFMISKDGSSNKNNVDWKPYKKQNAPVLNIDADKDYSKIKMKSKTYTDQDILNAMDQDTSVTPAQKKNIISKVMNGRWFSNGLDTKYNNLSDFDK